MLRIGVADVTTKKFVDSMNLDYTYVNAITSGVLATARIPSICPRTGKPSNWP